MKIPGFWKLKNTAVIIVFFIYSIVILLFPWSVHDVELTFCVADEASNSLSVQLFWDTGSNYNADECALAKINDQQATMTLDKEIVKNISVCRLDPVNTDSDIVFDSIAINGKELDLQQFVGWIVFGDQVTVSLDTETGSQLVCSVDGDDPKLMLNEDFTKALIRGTKMTYKDRMLWLLIGAAVFAYLLFFKRINERIAEILGKANSFLEAKLAGAEKRKTAACIIGIAVAVFIVMFKYLIGQKTFVFVDAYDSLGQTYPMLLETARFLSEGKAANYYNFNQALGSAMGNIKINLTNWVAYFGENHVAYLLGLSQAFKMFASGIFFYAFVRKRKVERIYSMILALGYVFCGHMTLRASWTNYPNEVMLVALCLLSFELLFQKKDWRWILPTLGLFFYHFSIGGYYGVIYIALFLGYSIFWFLLEKKFAWKKTLLGLTAGSILCVGYLYITEFSIVNSIMSNLSSERAQKNLDTFEWSLSGFQLDFSLVPGAFARTIGLGTTGIIGKNYTGPWNMLEDATFYCGIIVLLLIPLAFYCMNLKQRIIFALGYIVAILYCTCTQLRIIMNGFAGTTFKLCSLWIILLMLLTVTKLQLDKICVHKKTTTTISILTMLALWLLAYRLPLVVSVDQAALDKSLAFLLVEEVLICLLIWNEKLETVLKVLLLSVVCVEVVWFAYPIYNDRQTADASEYEDGTTNALAVIEEEADDTFYRIDKQYVTVGECDSLAQNYNGAAYYIGGDGPGASVTAFYDDMGLPGLVNNDNRRSYGFGSYTEVKTLLGVKYALTKADGVSDYGFEKWGESDEIGIYENNYAVPMGFVYTTAIERSTFESLNMNQRQQVLLEACLVEDGTSVLPLISNEQLEKLTVKEQLFDEYEIEYDSVQAYPFSYDGDPELDSFTIASNTEEELIAIQVTFDKAAKGYLYYSTESGETYSITIEQETESTGQIYEINISNVNKIWWVSPSWANLNSLRIAKIPKDQYYQLYINNINALQSSAVQLTSYSDDYMEGDFYTETAGILYLPIVNEQYYVSIDGEWQNLLMVNDAFIGVYVEAGKHSIVIKHPVGLTWDIYKNDIKNIVLCAIIIILGTVWMKFKRKRGMSDERHISSSTGIK